MRRVVLPLLILAALVGCDGLESREDARAKQTLIGSWYFEYKNPSERPVKTVVTLAASGIFSARERITGEPIEEKSSGLWYVTDGLLKLQTNEVDGKKLGTLDSVYFTCKLADLNSKDFACVQASEKRQLTFRRVQSDLTLS